jgi:hypothetical protein
MHWAVAAWATLGRVRAARAKAPAMDLACLVMISLSSLKNLLVMALP